MCRFADCDAIAHIGESHHIANEESTHYERSEYTFLI